MSEGPATEAAIPVRELRSLDLQETIRIDALHTGESKPDYWHGVFRNFLENDRGAIRVGLAADGESGMIGYLLGEVRAAATGISIAL